MKIEISGRIEMLTDHEARTLYEHLKWYFSDLHENIGREKSAGTPTDRREYEIAERFKAMEQIIKEERQANAALKYKIKVLKEETEKRTP